ncbi:MAG: DUF2255 family protein [Solirubrobacteraceae bacterium]
MTSWTGDELARIGTADELELAALRRDGILRKSVTIWVVRQGDELYVRSAYGPKAAWFRGAQVRHEGRVRAGGIEKDVAFVPASHELEHQIDAAYSTKYRRYGERFIGTMTGPEARATTLKLVPRAPGTAEAR